MKTKRLLCLLLVAVMLLLPACGGQSGGDSGDKGNDADNGEVLLPISINGKEIRVGETTVQTLLDEGLSLSWVDENYERVIVDPSTVLEANTYFTGGGIEVSDNLSFNISIVTDEEKVTLGQAVIARMEIHTVYEDDESVLEKISFDGVPITELTREMAGEKYPDWTGDEVMWLKYGLQYKYDLNFDMTSGALTGFTVECKYDVDWNS